MGVNRNNMNWKLRPTVGISVPHEVVKFDEKKTPNQIPITCYSAVLTVGTPKR